MEFEKPSYSVSEEFYKQNKRPRTEETTGSNNNKNSSVRWNQSNLLDQLYLIQIHHFPKFV